MVDVQDESLDARELINRGLASTTDNVARAAEILRLFLDKVVEVMPAAETLIRGTPERTVRQLLSRVRAATAEIMYDLSPDRTVKGIDDSLGGMLHRDALALGSLILPQPTAPAGVDAVLDGRATKGRVVSAAAAAIANGSKYTVDECGVAIFAPRANQVALNISGTAGSTTVFRASHFRTLASDSAMGNLVSSGIPAVGANRWGNGRLNVTGAANAPLAGSFIRFRTVRDNVGEFIGEYEVFVPAGVPIAYLRFSANMNNWCYLEPMFMLEGASTGNRSVVRRDGTPVTVDTTLSSLVGNLPLVFMDNVVTHESTEQFLRFVRAAATLRRGVARSRLHELLQEWWNYQPTVGAFPNRIAGDGDYTFGVDEVNTMAFWLTGRGAITQASMALLYRKAYQFWMMKLGSLEVDLTLNNKLVNDFR
jgi:hypothetical protein